MSLTTIKALVVDDSALMRQALLKVLHGVAECSVMDEAADGAQALQVAHRLKPDLVVMDIRMPVMGGFEALRLLKNEAPDIQVVLITSILEPGIRDHALSLGALECLQKDGNLWRRLQEIMRNLPQGASTVPVNS